MKLTPAIALSVAFCTLMQTFARDLKVNPLNNVISLLDDLAKRLEKDEFAENQAYREFYNWCDVVTGDKLHSIKLDKERKEKLQANIQKYFAEIEQSGEQISEEAKAIAEAIAEGRNAKDLREKQHADFMAAESELSSSIDMLSRAVTVLEREMQKGSASFAQMVDAKLPSVLKVLRTVTEAAAFSASDRSKLLALVDDDDEMASPSSDVYAKKSGGIIQVLTDLKDKAESQLADLRKGEQQARNVFNQLVAALKAQQEADEKDKAKEKEDKDEASEDKADAQQDLAGTAKVLDVHTEAYRQTKAQCLQNANDHEAAVASRKEEMKAVSKAKEIITSTTTEGSNRLYSFLQESSLQQVKLHSTSDLVHLEVVTLINHMAKTHHSTELAQLASQVSAYAKYGGGAGEDIFAKIKGLIRDLISKLENDAKADATEKAYCDKELAATQAKVGDVEDQLQKLSTQIDRKTAKSTAAKEEVKELQEELAKNMKEQTELDKVRQDEHAAFIASKADLELGLKGIRQALDVLRDYYSGSASASTDVSAPADASAPSALADVSATPTETSTPVSLVQRNQQPTPPDLTHYKANSAGTSIISILEMAEGDFATGLAKEQTEESDSQSDYEKAAKENELETTTLNQQVKFKTKEYKRLDKEISQLVDDRDASYSENAAVLEYSVKIKDRCIGEPKDYAERKARRENIITGLKEALAILKNDAVLMQRKQLRGSK